MGGGCWQPHIFEPPCQTGPFSPVPFVRLPGGREEAAPTLYINFSFFYLSFVPTPMLTLKTWGLLHLRLENLPKMYTAKFSLYTRPQNHKGISSDSLIATLCFWSALNVFLVTNRP